MPARNIRESAESLVRGRFAAISAAACCSILERCPSWSNRCRGNPSLAVEGLQFEPWDVAVRG